jgi:hypothetical protein
VKRISRLPPFSTNTTAMEVSPDLKYCGRQHAEHETSQLTPDRSL